MQLSQTNNLIRESTSLIIEPTDNSGALLLGNISSLTKSYKQNQVKAAITVCEFSDFHDTSLFINFIQIISNLVLLLNIRNKCFQFTLSIWIIILLLILKIMRMKIYYNILNKLINLLKQIQKQNCLILNQKNQNQKLLINLLKQSIQQN